MFASKSAPNIDPIQQKFLDDMKNWSEFFTKQAKFSDEMLTRFLGLVQTARAATGEKQGPAFSFKLLPGFKEAAQKFLTQVYVFFGGKDKLPKQSKLKEAFAAGPAKVAPDVRRASAPITVKVDESKPQVAPPSDMSSPLSTNSELSIDSNLSGLSGRSDSSASLVSPTGLVSPTLNLFRSTSKQGQRLGVKTGLENVTGTSPKTPTSP